MDALKGALSSVTRRGNKSAASPAAERGSCAKASYQRKRAAADVRHGQRQPSKEITITVSAGALGNTVTFAGHGFPEAAGTPEEPARAVYLVGDPAAAAAAAAGSEAAGKESKKKGNKGFMYKGTYKDYERRENERKAALPRMASGGGSAPVRWSSPFYVKRVDDDRFKLCVDKELRQEVKFRSPNAGAVTLSTHRFAWYRKAGEALSEDDMELFPAFVSAGGAAYRGPDPVLKKQRGPEAHKDCVAKWGSAANRNLPARAVRTMRKCLAVYRAIQQRQNCNVLKVFNEIRTKLGEAYAALKAGHEVKKFSRNGAVATRRLWLNDSGALCLAASQSESCADRLLRPTKKSIDLENIGRVVTGKGVLSQGVFRAAREAGTGTFKTMVDGQEDRCCSIYSTLEEDVSFHIRLDDANAVNFIAAKIRCLQYEFDDGATPAERRNEARHYARHGRFQKKKDGRYKALAQQVSRALAGVKEEPPPPLPAVNHAPKVMASHNQVDHHLISLQLHAGKESVISDKTTAASAARDKATLQKMAGADGRPAGAKAAVLSPQQKKKKQAEQKKSSSLSSMALSSMGARNASELTRMASLSSLTAVA